MSVAVLPVSPMSRGRWIVPLLSLALSLAGLVVLYSASLPVADKLYGDVLYFARHRLLYLGIGAAAAAMAMSIPMRWWEKTDWLWLLVVLSLLLATLMLGAEVNGAKRWLRIGAFSFQPSEMAKIVVPMYLAGYCMRRAGFGQLGWMRTFHSLGVVSIVLSLILLEPDFGTSALLFAVSLSILFIAGIRLGQLALLVVLGGGMSWLLISTSAYRMERWRVFIDPLGDPYGSGWQLTQSMIAFARGGFFGEGVGESVQKQFHLPEAHNDYILAVLAEEVGTVGVVAVLVAFLAIALRSFIVAGDMLRGGALFTGYFVFGIGLLLIGQVLLNAGSVVGMLPPKGIVLPLFSSGGSSLIATCFCLGLLIRAEQEWIQDERKVR